MESSDKSNRITITLNAERCLHARSVWADCSLCMDTCPGGAIRRAVHGKGPELDLSRCMQCGQCISACPLEAFEAPDFTERQLLSRVSGRDPISIRCLLPYGELESLSFDSQTYQLGACIAALSPGALFELSLNRPCTLANDRCSSCPVFRMAKPTMQANITGAFRMLHGIGKSGNLKESTPIFLPQIKVEYSTDDEERRREGIKSSIRSLFGVRNKSRATRKALSLRQKSKHVPSWRRRLKEVWTRNAYSASGACDYEWSELVVDPQRCVACGICMQMCPTGTIVHSFVDQSFTYAFVPGTCANCGLCISVCPNSALSRDYRSFERPFEEQIRYGKPARECVKCGRPVLDSLEGDYCYRCEHESNRVPMMQKLRAQLGVKSYGDLEREKAKGGQGA